MKTTLTLFLLTLLVVGCINSVVYEGDSANNKKNIVKFSKHIETYIERHVVSHFLEHVEPIYKKDQLSTALNGDTTQFVNEFFCGQDTSMTFKCVNFNEIKSIDLIEIIPEKNQTYRLKYKIVNEGNNKIISEVFLFTDTRLYQLYSAVG